MPNSNNHSNRGALYGSNTLTIKPKPNSNLPSANNGIMVVNGSTTMPSISNGGSGGFFQSIKDGFAIGTGVNLAERLVSSIFGNRKVDIVNSNPQQTGTPGQTNYVYDNHCDYITYTYNKLLENNEMIPEKISNEYNRCSSIPK